MPMTQRHFWPISIRSSFVQAVKRHTSFPRRKKFVVSFTVWNFDTGTEAYKVEVQKVKKIRIIADPSLFSLTLTVMIMACGALAWFLWMSHDAFWTSEADKIAGELTFFVLILTPISISLFWDTRWANVLVLSPEKIELRSCFKKPITYEYQEFPYIYRASYRHNLAGAPDVGPVIVYLVLSRRRLSSFEKTHINQVTSPTDVIKIKFSKKRYQALLEYMPPKLSREVARTFASYLNEQK